jgi:hypothetical protein
MFAEAHGEHSFNLGSIPHGRSTVRRWLFLIGLASISVVSSIAQDAHQSVDMPRPSDHDMQDMPGMEGEHKMSMESHSLIEFLGNHVTSGTDAEPNSTPSQMLMTERGGWTFMFHGQASLADIQQSGLRGADKLFSTNWIMLMAQRKIGSSGTLTLRTMLSFEPATVSQRRYPELFQQGETAFGRPIVDGQHPHDLFMELATMYDYKLGEKTMLSFYAAPMGDPAMGPPAYPHRASASEDPLAPLGHHLQDSTHVADDVITVGFTYRDIRLEASGFHGREPDEYRWDLDSGKIDSWSTRVTVNPGQNWSFQYSIAQLRSPEALASDEDIRRMTGSLMYNRPFHEGNWASMILWGRNQSLSDGNVGNGFLVESTLRFLNRNYAWTRIENVDRTNELLLGQNALPPDFKERFFTRVQAYTAGYDRDIGHIPHLSTSIGGQVTWYGVPEALRPVYGSHPVGVTLLVHVRPH